MVCGDQKRGVCTLALLADKSSMRGANCESPRSQLGGFSIGHWPCQRSADRKKMIVIMTIQ